MHHRRALPILVAGILLGGAAVFVARHRVLTELRSPATRVWETPEGRVGTDFTGPTAAAQAVPTSLLRLRAENQALHREVEAATERIRNLTRTPPFDPADSPAQAAQVALIEELRQIASGPDFAEAGALGQALAGYVAQNGGRLPASLDAVRTRPPTADSSSSADTTGGSRPRPASGARLTYELLAHGDTSDERRARGFVARSEEIPMASGKLARLFIRSDGGVTIGVVEESSDWSDWLVEQEARGQAVPPTPKE